MTLGDACISPHYGCLSSVPDACPGLAFLDHDGSSSFSYCWTGPRLTDVDGVALVLEVQLIYTLVSVSAVQRWGSVMSVAGVGGGGLCVQLVSITGDDRIWDLIPCGIPRVLVPPPLPTQYRYG